MSAHEGVYIEAFRSLSSSTFDFHTNHFSQLLQAFAFRPLDGGLARELGQGEAEWIAAMHVAIGVQGGSRAAGPARSWLSSGKRSSWLFVARLLRHLFPGRRSGCAVEMGEPLVQLARVDLAVRAHPVILDGSVQVFIRRGQSGVRKRAFRRKKGGSAAPVVNSGVFGLDAEHCVRGLGLNDLRMRGRWMYSVSPP